MHFIPIRTRVLIPPQDNLYSALIEAQPALQDGDILLVTSKVVAIHEGRCVKMSDVHTKRELVLREADFALHEVSLVSPHPITIIHHALISSAGIDESNSDGYYTLLPKEPFRSAENIQSFLCETYSLQHLGVIITDSHSLPLRRGAIGISIGVAGFHPVNEHRGRPDLFGRLLTVSSTNLPDALAAGASAVCGEADESTPLIIVRNVPNVRFTTTDVSDELLVPYDEDIYAPLLRPFYRSNVSHS